MYKLKYYDVILNIERVIFKKANSFLAKLDKKYKSKEVGDVGWNNKGFPAAEKLPNGIYYWFHISYLKKIVNDSIMDIE